MERDAFVGARLVHSWLVAKTTWRRRAARIRAKRPSGSESVASDCVIRVRPTAIRHCSLVEFSLSRFRGAVVDGNWDLSAKAFTELDIYVALRDVLRDRAADWEETQWYQACVQRIQAGEMLWNCRDEGEWRQRLRRVSQLYENVASKGYLTQEQLSVLRPSEATGDEIAIAIGRSGELLFSDGAHRLCIALLLGLEEVPAEVAVRHPAWSRVRLDLADYAVANGGTLYQPALHPDLLVIPSAHSCVDRWELFESRLPSPPGRALDLGANLGYFAHRLEALGWECTAVENDPAMAGFMKAIRDANGLRFEVVTQSIVSGCLRQREFDVVLALNILHHFLKTRQEYLSLRRFLTDLTCSQIILEPHGPDEPQMVGAYAALPPADFVALVAELTRLDVVTPLGEAPDGRMVYRLSRSHGSA